MTAPDESGQPHQLARYPAAKSLTTGNHLAARSLVSLTRVERVSKLSYWGLSGFCAYPEGFGAAFENETRSQSQTLSRDNSGRRCGHRNNLPGRDWPTGVPLERSKIPRPG